MGRSGITTTVSGGLTVNGNTFLGNSGADFTGISGNLSVYNNDATVQPTLDIDVDNASNTANAVIVRNYGGEGIVIQPYDAVSRAAISVRTSAGAYTSEWRMTGEFRSADTGIGLSFLSDSDTGLGRTGANALALYTGNVARLSVDSVGDTTISGVLTVSGAGLSDFTGSVRAAGFRVGANTGITVSCGGNAYIESIIISGGIVSGGTCQADIDTNSGGDILGVTAGNGLTGGGTSGTPILTVGGGTCISVGTTSVSVTANCINDATIADNSITAGSLAANSVGASEIAANAVGTSEIATSGVASAEVADNSLTASDLAANSVGASEIDEAAIITAAEFRYTGYGWAIRNSADTDTGFYHVSSGSWRLYANNVDRLSYDSNNVFVGGGATTNIQVNGNGFKVGGGSWGVYSDSRLKKNINAFTDGIDKIRQINPVSFQYNGNTKLAPDNGVTYYGAIAQAMQQIAPYTVTENEDGYLSFDSSAVTFMLINAAKDLDLTVQSNASRLSSVESRLSVLESTNNSLTKANITVNNQFNAFRIKVTGTAELANLKVTGLTELADLKVDRIISKGNTPTAVLGANTTGQGSAYTIEGNDTAGTVEYTSGTNTVQNPLASGEQITITFDKPFDTTPRITLTPLTAEAATLDYFVTRDVNGFKINFTSPPTAATTYSFDYQILQ